MDSRTLEKHLKIAGDAAIAAGKYLAGCNRENIRVDPSEGKDIKISADKESESIIIDFLRKKTNIAILSEEKGFIKATEDSELTWVVDPLDGSINFLKGIPASCVSIALCRGEKPLLGAIYDFNRGELYTGVNRGGAWLNGREIAVSKTNAIEKAIMFTGFPSNADFSPAALGKMVEQIRAFLKLRWIGSAALSLAYVAAGRGDAYMENGIRLWDVAAGLAIVAGAGGKYSLSETDRHGVYNVCATNNLLPILTGKTGRER
jgi:fructose-1,6-bisphosphatase/inositol monophosphatase family enzyme